MKQTKIKDWRMYLSWWGFLLAEHFVSALLLTLAIGGTTSDFAQIWLSVSLNFFAIPMLFFAWSFVWWVNFVIVLTWIGYWSFRDMVKHLYLEEKSP